MQLSQKEKQMLQEKYKAIWSGKQSASQDSKEKDKTAAEEGGSEWEIMRVFMSKVVDVTLKVLKWTVIIISVGAVIVILGMAIHHITTIPQLKNFTTNLPQTRATDNSLSQDEFDKTVEQIKVLEDPERLPEQGKFESSEDYSARRKRHIEEAETQITNLYRQVFPTKVTVSLGNYDPDKERYRLIIETQLNGEIQPFERDLSINREDAESLHANWEKVIKTGYLSINPGYRRALTEVILENPIRQRKFSVEVNQIYRLLDEHNLAVAFSPNGKDIATGNKYGEVILSKVRNVIDNNDSPPEGGFSTSPLETLSFWWRKLDRRIGYIIPESDVNAAAFSSDRRYLAIGATNFISEGAAILWNVDSGKRIWTNRHGGRVNAVAFSPDGKYLATGATNAKDSKNAGLWEARTGKRIWLGVHGGRVNAVAFSPDGQYLATGATNAKDSKNAGLWEARTGKRIWLGVHGGRVNAVAFSPDGQYLATGAANVKNKITVLIFEANTQREVWRWWYGPNAVNAVAFSPDSRYLATGGTDQVITFWRIENAKVTKEKEIRTKEVIITLAWHPDGSLISDGRTVYRTLLEPEEQESDEPDPSYPPYLVATVAFSDDPDNTTLSANRERAITVTIANKGKGEAFDVRLTINPPQIDGLFYDVDARFGAIPSGDHRSVDVSIKASSDIPDGKHRLTFDFSEKNGFPPESAYLDFLTEVKPKLVFEGVGIDDANGNGIIERSEVVKLTVRIQNQGGNAKSVFATVSKGDNNVTILGKKKYDLGELEHGNHKDLIFEVATNSKAEDIPVFINVVEETGLGGLKDYRLPIALGKREKPPSFLPDPGRNKSFDKAPQLSIDIEQDIPSAARSNPDAVAVVIGIRDYAHAPRVEYAARDVQFVREYLKKALGYNEENILPRDIDKMMSLGAFQTLIRQTLPSYVKGGKSNVFIYYTGHGAPSLETREAFLVPYDCDVRSITADNAYRLQDFYADLVEIDCRSLTVVLDTCFSGITGKGETLFENISPGILPKVKIPEHPLLRHPKAIVLTSTSNDRVSNWYPDKKHSLFTYFFLKGLQGAADSNNDNRITVSELRAYLLNETNGVPYWSKRVSLRKQIPQIHASNESAVIVELK